MHCCGSEEERALSEGERCTSDDEESKESADTHTHTHTSLFHSNALRSCCCCFLLLRS